MRRIPIQFDDETYGALKKRAAQERRSIAAVVRESVGKYVTRAPLTISDFTFVGSGRNASDARERPSERHDEALANALSSRKAKR